MNVLPGPPIPEPPLPGPDPDPPAPERPSLLRWQPVGHLGLYSRPIH